MVVGAAEGSEAIDEAYPHEVLRKNLSMASRSIRSIASAKAYYTQARLLRRIVRMRSAEMMIACRPLSEGLVATAVSKLTGVPFISFVHGEDVECATTSRELVAITRPVLRNACALIANSNFTRNRLIESWNVSPDKVQLMNPGVDCSRFHPSDTPRRLDSWKRKTVILTVGRLQPRKGHDTVIQAIPLLIAAIPNLHYAIVGSGGNRERLAQLAHSLGVADRVEFLGEVDEDQLVKLFQDCDVFVMANRTIGKDVEGFGIVFLEAQACGKPVVAGASGGTADTLDDGVTGFLVNCQDGPDQLIRTIANRLAKREERQAMGEAARSFVLNHFDWTVLASEAGEFFQSMIARK